MTELSLLANQDFKQFRWIYFTDPEHLHGVMRGLSNYPASRQILQTWSLVVISEWFSLTSSSLIYVLVCGILKVKSSYTFLDSLNC